MNAKPLEPPAHARPRLPGPVREVLDRLREHGFEAALVGGCVRDALSGREVADFDIATSAAPEQVLRLFPRAVPIGLRHGTVMVPTAAGPVDITSFRCGARTLIEDLAHRDFTLNAVAWDPVDEEVIDPFGGLEDLRRGRLRTPGDPRARLAEDPLRALRAARLVAAFELTADPALVEAMRETAPKLAAVARERVRQELERLLIAPGAGEGLRLLRATGIEERLAPGVRSDAPDVVDRLPRELELRLAAWLRGTEAERTLGRLRFPRRTVLRVARWLRVHPLDAVADPERVLSLRRLLQRFALDELDALRRLREAELDLEEPASGPGHLALQRLWQALERESRSETLALRRRDLAVDGREVMKILGSGSGPEVGRALAYLLERVIEDPSRNRPEELRRLLLDWKEKRAAEPKMRAECGRDAPGGRDSH